MHVIALPPIRIAFSEFDETYTALLNQRAALCLDHFGFQQRMYCI